MELEFRVDVHVIQIVRTSEGEVRWMEASDWQKNARIFTGARFDVMTVRRRRDKAMGQ